MKDAYENDFCHSPSYRESYFNGSENITGIQVLITKFGYIKTIYMLPEDNLVVGDMIYFDDKHWICIDVSDNGVNKYGTVCECREFINVYSNGVLNKVYCAVESSIQLYRMGYDGGKYINTPEGIAVLRVSDDNITANIKRGQTYSIGRDNYKVIDIQDIVEYGILILKLEFTLEKPEPIPDPTPSQPITINGADSIIKGKSEIYTVNVDYDVVFSLEGSLADITQQSGNSCTIQAGQNLGYVKLFAKSLDGLIEGYRDIRIRSIF